MLLSLRIDWDRVVDRDVYPFNLPAIAGVDEIDLDAPVVTFVGANGSGKSTLMEAIAAQIGCNPEGGSPNFQFDATNTLSDLHKAMRLPRRIRRNTPRYFYRADAFHALATEIRRLEISDLYGDRDLHEMSHGQSVIHLIDMRFRPGGIYLMDEPEAALAPETQLEVIARIIALARDGARFVIATHSPLLMAIPGALIYELGPDGPVRRAYHELNHVRLYKRFLSDPQSVMSRLTEDE
ncbi:AAA family ATPase [Methylopila turkensis]|uniref:AAA+ ATPase domain-containing protein n=1 Tax=Methylopila turkensis TaxID=1437816 RepID=A0A9W6JQG5_9HYPH|nr:AAA family ATPase [Methylopila turkensis]GLK81886.1 hypothetical protein GCM10008174_36270 [Methylopila turkensis]